MTDIVEFWKCMMSKKIQIKGTQWNIVGNSWAARYTMFYIPELNISLDIGMETEQHPSHIFISHAHCDHTKSLVNYVLDKNDSPILIIPKPSVSKINEMILSHQKSTKHKKNEDVKIHWKIIESTILEESNIQNFLPNILKIKNIKFKIELFKCTHTIPTIGYGFIEQRTKLDDKFIGASQEVICEAVKKGLNVSKIENIHHFCYLLDTTHHVFYLNKECTIPNPNLEKYGTIIVECTFLYDDDLKQAKKTKHMHWLNLKLYVESHPNINFILTHFSIKYKPKDIIRFFEIINIPNIFPIVHDFEEYWFDKLVKKISSDDVTESVKNQLISSLSSLSNQYYCKLCTICKTKSAENHKMISATNHKMISMENDEIIVSTENHKIILMENDENVSTENHKMILVENNIIYFANIVIFIIVYIITYSLLEMLLKN